MAGGNFDGQAYNLGPMASIDQQDNRGRGTGGLDKTAWLKKLLGGNIGSPGTDIDPMFETSEQMIERLKRASLMQSLLGYQQKVNT